MGNGICDNNSLCNKFECFWDGHDCDDEQPLSAYYIDKRASYHQRYMFDNAMTIDRVSTSLNNLTALGMFESIMSQCFG